MNVLGRFLVVTPFVVLGFACKADKSENWLAPTVAGPIPGITITTPKPIEPGSGARVAVDTQPITLIVDNSSSNGPRPLSYAFEVAADASFTTKVFTAKVFRLGPAGRVCDCRTLSQRAAPTFGDHRLKTARTRAGFRLRSASASSPLSSSALQHCLLPATTPR